MGKGKNPCLGGTTAGAGGARAAITLEASTSSFEPYGPEATPEELDAYLDGRASWKDKPVIREKAHRALADPLYHATIFFPARRSLEAALALHANQDLHEYGLANAHRSWLDLAEEAESLTAFGGTTFGDMARHTEQGIRKAEFAEIEDPIGDRIRAWSREGWDGPNEIPAHLKALIAKAGPGARSGRLEDYTRAELRKLLGFLERDCKHLSDEDLRGMALDGHLVPQWEGSPSHVDLALRDAMLHASSERWSTRKFHRSMRTPYGRLARWAGVDRGKEPSHVLLQRLAKRNPLLAASGAISPHGLRGKLASAYIGDDTLPESRRHKVAEGAATKQLTKLELSYSEAFTSFTASLPGTTRLTNVKPNLGGHRGALGLYEPSTGTIYIHSSLTKLIDKAKLGEATGSEIEHAVSTIAHELFHAQEGRDEGNRYAGRLNSSSAEHCLDEGATEALARLHTDDLAERMGLWSRAEQGTLRDHATTGSYPREVETTVALTAAICGELDLQRLREGGYAQPDALSGPARQRLLELHTQNGIWGRIDELARGIAQRTGQPHQECQGRVITILKECKSNRYQWRTRPVREEDGSLRREYLEPQKLGERLAELMGDLG